MRGLLIKTNDGTDKFIRHDCDLCYVIQAEGSGGVVKVGRSSDPIRRIAGLASGVPFSVRTVALLSDGTRREKALKASLSASRVRGEWFTPTAALNEILKEAHQDNSIVERKIVDEDFYNKFIEPAALEYLNGRDPALTFGGDLIYRMLREGYSVYKGRIEGVQNALMGQLTPELANGYVPIGANVSTPAVSLISDQAESAASREGAAA